jgi:chemotaxis signal transduction protein
MPETAKMPDSANSEKYLVFSIFNRQYAFPAQVIGEVASCEPLYQLPLLPSYVLGVINRYSLPYALFDIGFLLSNEPGPRNEALVIKSDIDRVAFSIENVSGIADITPDKLIKIETIAGSIPINRAVSATFKWKDTDVYVLDIRHLLARVVEEAVQ